MKKCSIILIRGLVREKEHWGDFLPILQNTIPEANLHCIDIPGAGVKFQQPCPLKMKEIVLEMRKDSLHLNLDHRAPRILVAISLGGMIAAQWLNDFPHDFTHACLINTSYSGISPLWDRLKPSALLFMLKIPFLSGREKEKRILQLVSNNPDRPEKDADFWNEIQRLRPVSFTNTLRQMFAATTFSLPQHRPKVPLLVMGCPQDRMVASACSDQIAKRWKTSIVNHSWGGHDITGDDPTWVSEEIKKWLKEIEAI